MTLEGLGEALTLHVSWLMYLPLLFSSPLVLQQKVVRYFPTERGQPMIHGPLTLVLTSLKATPTHVERMITLQFRDQSLKRTVIHLQFSSWPELYVARCCREALWALGGVA